MAAAEALFFAHPFWVWLAVAAVFLVGELVSASGWLLWPAGAAALVGLLTAFVPLGWPLEIVLFVAAAIVATYVGRRLLPPAAKAGVDINDPAPRLVGHRGEAAAEFRGGRGRVFVDGKEWAAELEGGGDLPARAAVTVTGILGGARLKVRSD
ncbi:MAG: NfeD family protein [Caulobacteraceae bacterium]|nr:NfeD family protein [Caulobacteraceae bacterium]